MWTFLVSLTLSVLLPLIQTSSLILWFGVKPNLVLALLIAFALVERDWLHRLAVPFTALFMLNFAPSITLFGFYVAAIFLLAQAFLDLLPWQPIVNTSLALFTATLLINLEQFSLAVFASELLMNASLCFGLYLLLNWLWRKYPNSYA